MDEHDLSDSKISTITCHAILDSEIDTDIITECLPVRWDEVDETNPPKKIPHPGEEAIILFLRRGDVVRGSYAYLRTTEEFKNSISMDLSVDQKMINIKFSGQSVHMCGAKNKRNIVDVMRIFDDKIRVIEDFFRAVKDRVDIESHIVRFLKMTVGKNMTVTKYYDYESGKSVLKLVTIDKSLKYYSSYKSFVSSLASSGDNDVLSPDGSVRILPFDERVYNFLNTFMIEKKYHSHLRSRLWCLLDFIKGRMFKYGPLTYCYKISMQNYNYRLGFKISKVRVFDFIEQLIHPDIRADYHPDMSKNSLKILVWVKSSSRATGYILFNFTLYVCGNVTQSGPDDGHYDAYNLLIPLLRENRKHIEYMGLRIQKRNVTKNKSKVFKMLQYNNMRL